MYTDVFACVLCIVNHTIIPTILFITYCEQYLKQKCCVPLLSLFVSKSFKAIFHFVEYVVVTEIFITSS